MKRAISVILSVLLLLSSTGCSFFGPTVGEVYVSSGGERYSTVTNSVDENGRFTAADFKEFTLETVPYSAGITINLSGNRTGDVLYSLYDADYNEYYACGTALEIPVAIGTYYCIVEVTWGDEDRNETWQHCFCFTREE